MGTTEHSTSAGGEARSHLAIALDVAEKKAALELAAALKDCFSVAKVGLELFVAEGPSVVEALVEEGFDVFLDLKLHDIPNTVGRAAARARSLGAKFVTAHAAGGKAMLDAAVEGFSTGGPSASGGGILAVTVLTSDPDAKASTLTERARLAAGAGCAGVICAASDIEVVRAAGPALTRVVPGIRSPGAPTDDQARVATPKEAISLGGDILVIGRTVTAAPDPLQAARDVLDDVCSAL